MQEEQQQQRQIKEQLLGGSNSPFAVSYTLSKKNGGGSQTLPSFKVISFPVPPLLQRNPNLTDKIAQNNKVIQEILIESKKEQQQEIAQNQLNKKNKLSSNNLKSPVEESKIEITIPQQEERPKELNEYKRSDPFNKSPDICEQFKVSTGNQTCFHSNQLSGVSHQDIRTSSSPNSQRMLSRRQIKIVPKTKEFDRNEQIFAKHHNLNETASNTQERQDEEIKIKVSNLANSYSAGSLISIKGFTSQGRRGQRSLEKTRAQKSSKERSITSMRQSKADISRGESPYQFTKGINQIEDEIESFKVPMNKKSNKTEDISKYAYQQQSSSHSHKNRISHSPNHQNNNSSNVQILNSSAAELGLSPSHQVFQSQKLPKLLNGKIFNNYQQLTKILKDSLNKNSPLLKNEKSINDFQDKPQEIPSSSQIQVPKEKEEQQKETLNPIEKSKMPYDQVHQLSYPLHNQIPLYEDISTSKCPFFPISSSSSNKQEGVVLSFEKMYESSLKKEVPLALSDVPYSKQEIQGLQKWMKSTLNSIQKINDKSKVDHLSSMLNLSAKELLRQVSIECFERGDALSAIMRYQAYLWKDQLQKAQQIFLKIEKQLKNEILNSHNIYSQIFISKDDQINKLTNEAEETRNKLTVLISELEKHQNIDKNLRIQINRMKEIALYLKKRKEESDLQNKKLKFKLNKINIMKAMQEEQMKETARAEARFAAKTGEFIELSNSSQSSSVCSDLFNDKRSNQKQINLFGIEETIENLNCVPFTNPDDITKCQVEETQTGASLLIMGIMREAEAQTELQGLTNQDYDHFLTNSESLHEFMVRIDNYEAQIEYLKDRDRQLLLEIEQLKSTNQCDQTINSSFHVNTSLREIVESSKVMHTSSFLKRNEQDQNNELSQKYQGIMKKLNEDSKKDSKNVSSSSSQSDLSIEDQESNQKKIVQKKKITLLKTTQQKSCRQLGEKINQVESLFNDIGKQIVEKLKKNKYSKFRNYMPLPSVMKQINLVYLERLKMTNENSSRVKEQECSNFTYFFLTKLYGFKKIVDQKFIIFVLSLKKYSNVLRVNLFSRFVGLLDGRVMNFSLDEFNKYIEVLNYIFNVSTLGQQPSTYDIESRFLVPYIRVIQFVGSFGDTRMTILENDEFKKEVESLKESDPKGVHSAGLIDFDVFINKMLDKYRQLVNRAKTYVINAFAASDMDGNGVCNLDEFLILNRHIEQQIYDEEVLTQIFHEYSDNVMNGEACLSFDKFAIVSVDYNLFSDEQQDQFLQLKHKREIFFKLQELQTEWQFRQKELINIFSNLSIISDEQKNKWLEITSVLNDKLQRVSQSEQKPLLIAYQILLNESLSLKRREEECKKDEELLNQYQMRALKEQEEYSLHLHQEDFKKSVKMKASNKIKIRSNLMVSQFSSNAKKRSSQQTIPLHSSISNSTTNKNSGQSSLLKISSQKTIPSSNHFQIAQMQRSESIAMLEEDIREQQSLQEQDEDEEEEEVEESRGVSMKIIPENPKLNLKDKK